MMITVIRKPFAEKTATNNVIVHSCGGINIDACRQKVTTYPKAKGRFPTNLFLQVSVADIIDKQSLDNGTHPSGSAGLNIGSTAAKGGVFAGIGGASIRYGDDGGASRYFKVFK